MAEEFQILTDSWQHSSAFNKVFFVMMDYYENPEAFQIHQLMSVPSALHFSAKRKFMSDDLDHLEVRAVTAEHMAGWVAERTERRETTISLRYSTDYQDPFKLGIFLALIGGLVYLWKWNRKCIFNKNLWQL